MENYIRRIFVRENNNIYVQFFRYAIVGGFAALADISVFYLAANIIGINHIIANTMSFIFGLLLNYFMSRVWVFNKQTQSMIRDFILFAVIGVIGLLLSNMILYVLVDLRLLYNIFAIILSFNGDNFTKISAKLVSVFIVLFWNFVARKKIVFA